MEFLCSVAGMQMGPVPLGAAFCLEQQTQTLEKNVSIREKAGDGQASSRKEDLKSQRGNPSTFLPPLHLSGHKELVLALKVLEVLWPLGLTHCG